VGYNQQHINTLGLVGNAINVPNSMWTAGCCVLSPNDVESFAVIGNYLPKDSTDPNEPLTRQITVKQLEKFLADDVDNQDQHINGPNVNLFPAGYGACSNAANDLPVLP